MKKNYSKIKIIILYKNLIKFMSLKNVFDKPAIVD